MKSGVKLFVAGALAAAIAASGVVAVRPTGQDRDPMNLAIDPALRMPPQVAGFVIRSCGDCHTSRTRWPWYARLPLVSQMMRHDVERARRAMSFTEWSGRVPSRGQASGLLAAACADLESGRMPLRQYLWMHPEVRPKQEEVHEFCSWAHQPR